MRSSTLTLYDDEPDDEDQHPPLKRFKPTWFPPAPPARSSPGIVPGRYVSKRERAAMAASSLAQPAAPALQPPPELPSVLNAGLPPHIQRKLDHNGARNRCPQERAVKLEGHTKAAIAVRWSPTHGALLASGGMDGKAYVWNAWGGPGKQMARCLSCHAHVRWQVFSENQVVNGRGSIPVKRICSSRGARIGYHKLITGFVLLTRNRQNVTVFCMYSIVFEHDQVQVLK